MITFVPQIYEYILEYMILFGYLLEKDLKEERKIMILEDRVETKKIRGASQLPLFNQNLNYEKIHIINILMNYLMQI